MALNVHWRSYESFFEYSGHIKFPVLVEILPFVQVTFVDLEERRKCSYQWLKI